MFALVAGAVSVPAVAWAQSPSRAAILTERYGSPQPLPADVQRQAVGLLLRQTTAKYAPVPDAFDPKATENLEELARWAADVRAQRELIAALLVALDTPDMERQVGGKERVAALRKLLAEQLANRDGWLDKAGVAYLDRLRKNAERQRWLDSLPSISPAGPPQPPRRPVMIKSPQYMAAVDGLFPETMGMGLSAGNIPLRPGMGISSPSPASLLGKGVGHGVAVLDIIQFGYSAGGWMGNEVIIKGQMYENYQRQKEYEARYKEYEARVREWNAGGGGRREWEEWQARLRQERQAAADLQFRTFAAIWGWRTSTYVPPKKVSQVDPETWRKLLDSVPERKPAAPGDDRFADRRAVLGAIQMNSAMRCHQPQNNGGFNLSLTGFNGGRYSTTGGDDELHRKLFTKEADGAGMRRK